ncbi:hypothetical protein GBF35_29650 [Nonomuraea phyllanthi]|uniref:carboxymuconolactone decarboxylase family protein n=1 Tax=Nonomuraea phyllanthi TaxID=2219224 RepID=UPI001293DCBC|nr:carboxymuconolactone decarboxylase family protein [Nonomuraea phyllanthi]QFY10241.1 hypothetical protein GBF35_29650 [Nonomuraea phyllanthi]
MRGFRLGSQRSRDPRSPRSGGPPRTTLEMVNVRASQINGCGLRVDMHTRALRAAVESDERIACVSRVPYSSERCHSNDI